MLHAALQPQQTPALLRPPPSSSSRPKAPSKRGGGTTGGGSAAAASAQGIKKPRAAAASAEDASKIEEAKRLQARSKDFAELQASDVSLVNALPTRDVSKLALAPVESGMSPASVVRVTSPAPPASPLRPSGEAAASPLAAAAAVPPPTQQQPDAAPAREELLALGAMPLHRPMFHIRHIRELALRANAIFQKQQQRQVSGGDMEISQRAPVMRRGATSAAAAAAAAAPETTPLESAADAVLDPAQLPADDPAYPTIDRWRVERAYVDRMYESRFRYHAIASAIDPDRCQFPTPIEIGPEFVDRVSTEPYGPLKACTNGNFCVGWERYHPQGSFPFSQYVPPPDWDQMERTGQVPASASFECYWCLFWNYSQLADDNITRRPNRRRQQQQRQQEPAAAAPAPSAPASEPGDREEHVSKLASLFNHVPILFYHAKNKPGGYAEIGMREIVEGYEDGLTHPLRRFDLHDLEPCMREVRVRVADAAGRVGVVVRTVRAHRERDYLRFRDKNTFEKADGQLLNPAAEVVSRLQNYDPPRAEPILHAALVEPSRLPGGRLPGQVEVRPPEEASSSSLASRQQQQQQQHDSPAQRNAEMERSLDDALLASSLPSESVRRARESLARELLERAERVAADPSLPPLARAVALERIMNEMSQIDATASRSNSDSRGRGSQIGDTESGHAAGAGPPPPSGLYVWRLPELPRVEQIDPPPFDVPPPQGASSSAHQRRVDTSPLPDGYDVSRQTRLRDICFRPLETAALLLRSWCERLYAGDWSRLAGELGLEARLYASELLPCETSVFPPLDGEHVLLHLIHARASLASRLLRGMSEGVLNRQGQPLEETDAQRTQSEKAKQDRRSRQASANAGLVRQLDHFLRHQQPLLLWYRRQRQPLSDAALLAQAQADGARYLDLLTRASHLEPVPIFQEDFSRVRYLTELVWREDPWRALVRELSSPTEDETAHVFCDFGRTLEFLDSERGRATRIPTDQWMPGFAAFEIEACLESEKRTPPQQQQTSSENAAADPAPSSMMNEFVQEMGAQARVDARRKRLAQVRKKQDVVAQRTAESMHSTFEEEALLLQADSELLLRSARLRLEHMRAKNSLLASLFASSSGQSWWRAGGLVEGRGYVVLAALVWRVNVASAHLHRELERLARLDEQLRLLRDDPGATSGEREHALALEMRSIEERVQNLKRFVNSHLPLAQGILDAACGSETDARLMRAPAPGRLPAYVLLYPHDVAARNDESSLQLIVKKVSLGALYYGITPSPLQSAPRVNDVRIYGHRTDADEDLARLADELAASGEEGTGDWREMICKAFPKASSEHAFVRKNDAYCVLNPLYYRFVTDSLRASLLGLYRHARCLPDFATALSLDRMFLVASQGYSQRRPARTARERASQQVLRSLMMRNKKLMLMVLRQVEQTPGFEWADTFAVMDLARRELFSSRSLSRANEVATRARRSYMLQKQRSEAKAAAVEAASSVSLSSLRSGLEGDTATAIREEDDDDEDFIREEEDDDGEYIDDDDDAIGEDEEDDGDEPTTASSPPASQQQQHEAAKKRKSTAAAKKKAARKPKKKPKAKKKKSRRGGDGDDDGENSGGGGSSSVTNSLSGTYRVTHNDLLEYMCKAFRSIDSIRLIAAAMRAADEAKRISQPQEADATAAAGDSQQQRQLLMAPRRIYRLSRELVDFLLHYVETIPPGSPIRIEWLSEIGVSERGVETMRTAYRLWRDRAFDPQVEACLRQLERMDYELLSVFFYLLRDHCGTESRLLLLRVRAFTVAAWHLQALDALTAVRQQDAVRRRFGLPESEPVPRILTSAILCSILACGEPKAKTFLR